MIPSARNRTPLGGLSAGRHERGLLVEYTQSSRPLVLPFFFNPSTIRRVRSVSVKTGGTAGSRGGYGFRRPDEAPRASQGVSVQAESFSLTILLDVTDRMNLGDPIASQYGVQPEIDVIGALLEPKPIASAGARDLAITSEEDGKAHETHEVASVLIFKWGKQVLPVFMTQAQIDGKEYLPNLFPYRAEAALTFQIIESDNPFYNTEVSRQQNTARSFVALAGVAAELLKF